MNKNKTNINVIIENAIEPFDNRNLMYISNCFF